MKTREELIEQFDLNPDDEDQAALLKQLNWVQRAGKVDGSAGRHPDGDYISDHTWKSGIGKTIAELEATLSIDDGAVFDLYDDAHSEFLHNDEVDEQLEEVDAEEVEEDEPLED